MRKYRLFNKVSNDDYFDIKKHQWKCKLIILEGKS